MERTLKLPWTEAWRSYFPHTWTQIFLSSKTGAYPFSITRDIFLMFWYQANDSICALKFFFFLFLRLVLGDACWSRGAWDCGRPRPYTVIPAMSLWLFFRSCTTSAMSWWLLFRSCKTLAMSLWLLFVSGKSGRCLCGFVFRYYKASSFSLACGFLFRSCKTSVMSLWLLLRSCKTSVMSLWLFS